MKARKLLEESVHTPEALKVVFAAFDMAWAQLEKEQNVPASAREEERHRLASMMLSFVTEGVSDSVWLKDRTLQALRPPA
jgi:hypothetical protein